MTVGSRACRLSRREPLDWRSLEVCRMRPRLFWRPRWMASSMVRGRTSAVALPRTRLPRKLGSMPLCEVVDWGLRAGPGAASCCWVLTATPSWLLAPLLGGPALAGVAADCPGACARGHLDGAREGQQRDQQRNRAPRRVTGRASRKSDHRFHAKSSAEPAGHFVGLCLSIKRCLSAKDVCKTSVEYPQVGLCHGSFRDREGGNDAAGWGLLNR